MAKRLAGKAVVINPPASGGDSANVLRNLEAWLVREQPAVVHLNCGLHDLKFSRKDQKHQVELAQYEANLRQILARLKQETAEGIISA